MLCFLATMKNDNAHDIIFTTSYIKNKTGFESALKLIHRKHHSIIFILDGVGLYGTSTQGGYLHRKQFKLSLFVSEELC